MKRAIHGLAVLAVAITAATAAASKPRTSDDLPSAGLTPYSEYRNVLIQNGWTPQARKGVKWYAFPEVVCGNAFCTASWHGPAYDAEIVLWNDDKLVVAPQY